MQKIVLSVPLALSAVIVAPSLQAPPAGAATVTVSGTSTTSCTYSGVTVDSNGNMTVTCAGAPGPTPAPSPGPTPSPTPSPSPSPTTAPPPSGCPATPANAVELTTLRRPPSGGSFESGQRHYDNPATVISDGTINSSQILYIPFTPNGLYNTTRATLGPGNFGGVAKMQMTISTCPGSFDPAYHAVPNNASCTSTRNAPSIYTEGPYAACPIQLGRPYYINIRASGAQEPTTAFLFNFT